MAIGTATALLDVTPDHRSLAAGAALFRQGDASIGIFLLISGRIRLQRITPDGAAVSIHLARPGELFAEASLFSELYHCDAIAEVDSEVWLYPKGQLARSLHTKPEALWSFARELARRLQELRLRYELKQIRSANERVLQLLRMRCGKDGVYSITGSLKEVAAYVGLTHEAFYRALTALEKRGLIARGAGAIRLTGRRD
jgi:CRP-like cAMP-binding protein